MTLNYRKIFWFSLGIKLLLAVIVPMTMDEYYYFLWGKKLSLSYFDHPPMVGWLMAFSQPLKFIADGAIRWPFILMTHGTLFLWDSILKPHLDDKRRVLFLLIGLLNPLWGWGSLIATPDIPLVFFWSLALFFVSRILLDDEWRNYFGLAFALGFGFLSKYHVALFLPCLLLMLWQQKQFYKLLKPKAWFAILLALLFCSPVFIWNAQNEWASIDFQWKHGMSFKYWKWTLPIEYLFGQLFIIFPTFLLFVFQKDRGWIKHWLSPFALLPYAFFLYSSFKGRVEANWVIMSLPCVYGLFILFTHDSFIKYGRRTLYFWTFVFLIALSAIPLKNYLPPNHIKLFESDRYQPLISQLDDNTEYYAYSYQLASFLSFKKDRLICKFPGYGRPDHFQYFSECQSYKDGFFYITEDNDRRDFTDVDPGLFLKNEENIGNHFKIVEVGAQ